MSISLEDVLGLAAATKPQLTHEKIPEKKQSTAELKIAARRRRVFELRCRGYTIPQICEKLGEEGQIWCENTFQETSYFRKKRKMFSDFL